jgi:hypothetical protein
MQIKDIIDEKLIRESEEIIGELPGSIHTVTSNLFNEFEI